MVSAMILLLGSQVDMFAQQKKGGPDYKKPGMEMHMGMKPGRPMDKKAIREADIRRVQDFYWKQYRVKLSKKEAEKILIAEMRDDRGHKPGPAHRPAPGPAPKVPQAPHKK